MALKKSQLRLLEPYLAGTPRDDGECDLYCPLHDDGKRSASINLDSGVWYCHAGCGGGRISDLLSRRGDWIPARNGARGRSSARRAAAGPPEAVTDDDVSDWATALLEDVVRFEDLRSARGLHTDTIINRRIGWDAERKVYTIPVFDRKGKLVSLRRYDLRPREGRRKMWGVRGMNSPALYPIDALAADEIVVCEGELDALITEQFGFPTITRTGSAGTWRPEWSEMFSGKKVFLAGDADVPGQEGNLKVAHALARYADEIRIVRLPYPVTEKHGKDLTDWWLEHDGETSAFRRMLDDSPEFDGETVGPETLDPSDATVLDAFDAERVGRPLRLTVTIKGKREPGYSVPRRAKFSCTMDAGEKCAACPMRAAGGEMEATIPSRDPLILEMMNATKAQVTDALRRGSGIVKCNRLRTEIPEYQSVEVLFARPSVEHVRGGSSSEDYKGLKITSVGRHDTSPNNTVSVVGALFPDPRRQLNEFLAWDVARQESSLDRFEMTDALRRELSRFAPKKGERPLRKFRSIVDSLVANVTQIYGRPEMHALMDLAFHSALSFDFAGKRLERGWLDVLVVGDTRTGKSEVATRLSRHYGAGEVVSCEAASFAGVIGGLQQYGATKEWAVTWGAIPINDRRLVVLDEVGGLSVEGIAEMSSVRSSGIAELTKIQQERTHARTRLIWLGNPRNGRMSDYTYGVQAILPLIGSNEDVARFDLAMSVAAGEVSSDEINRRHDRSVEVFDRDLCSLLLRWGWSRTAEQILWQDGAEDAVFAAAKDLGSRYVEDPPLVQSANVREKVARIAVALAIRLFSSDPSGEKVLVEKAHVQEAVVLLDQIYEIPSFGYAERSRTALANVETARAEAGRMRTYLRNNRSLAVFLRESSSFRRQDVEEVLNLDRESANAVINTLWTSRMVRKDKGDVRVEPTLHDLLRKMEL